MPRMPNYKIIPATKQNFAVVINLLVSLYIKRGKVSVTLYVGLYNAGRGANDVIMRIAGFVADGTGRRYGDWRHVATGCNALVVSDR